MRAALLRYLIRYVDAIETHTPRRRRHVFATQYATLRC